MSRLSLATIAVVWTCLSIGSASAEDQIIDVKPCTILCKLWRNLSGKTDAAAGIVTSGSALTDGPAPSATDGIEKPRSSAIAAKPGVVVVQSAAERAEARRQKRAMDAMLAGGAKPFDPAAPGK